MLKTSNITSKKIIILVFSLKHYHNKKIIKYLTILIKCNRHIIYKKIDKNDKI